MPPVRDSAAATVSSCESASSPTRSASRACVSLSTGPLAGPSTVSLLRDCTGVSYPGVASSIDPFGKPDRVERGMHLDVVVEVDEHVARRPSGRGRHRVLDRRLPGE